MRSRPLLPSDLERTSKLKILFVTTELPYPTTSGGRIKTFRWLKSLTQYADVKMICAYGGEREADVKAFRSQVSLSAFQAFQSHKPRSLMNVLKAFLFAPTLNAYRIEDREITSMIKWSASDVDLVIVDHLECIHLLPEEFRFKVIYHAHNAEFRLWEAFAETQSGLRKFMLRWEAKRVKALERFAISRSVFSFMAPNDQKAIQETIGFKDEAFRTTYHLGNDELLQEPKIDLESNEKKLFYAGSLNWEPNSDGLRWFLQNVWPIVQKSDPETTFTVCGKGASEDLVQIMRHAPNVQYKGFVESLDEEMRTSRAAVIPLRFGSGMKIKVFDAMYRGLPLVTTNFGAEGIDVENNKHAFIVTNAEEFASATITLTQNTVESTTIRDNAKQLCLDRYTYEGLFKEMLSAILDVTPLE